MWWIIGFLVMMLVLLWALGLCRVAGQADDRMEAMIARLAQEQREKGKTSEATDQDAKSAL